MTVEELQAAFLAKLHEVGLAPHDPNFVPLVDQPGVQRFRVGDGDSGQAGRCKLWSQGNGWYQDMRGKIEEGVTTWHFNGEMRLTKEQREEIEARKEESALEKKLKQGLASLVLSRECKDAPPPPEDYPYLVAKKIKPLGSPKMLRFHGHRRLFVPLHDAKGKICGGEYILPDGNKQYVKEARKQGLYHLIGDPPTRTQPVVLIAEGYATGCTVHQATRKPVAVAMDSGNLPEAAFTLQQAYPFCTVYIAADDDPSGAGYNAAAKACAKLKIPRDERVVLPDFNPLTRRPKDSDFNDLAARQGVETVESQLLARLPTTLPDFEDYDREEALEIEEPPVVVEGILRQHDVLCVVGGSKTAKTYFLLQMAVAAVHRMPWLERDIAPGNVLFVNFELRRDDIKLRIRKIEEGLNLTGEESQAHKLSLWNLKGHEFSAATLLAQLKARVAKGNYVFVFIDPMYKLLGEAEENNAAQMARIMNEIERIPAQIATTIVFSDHTPKGDLSDRDVLDLMSGSGVKGRSIDAALAIRKHEDWATDSQLFVLEGVARHFAVPDTCTAKFNWPFWELKSNIAPVIKKPGRGGANKKGNLLAILKAIQSGYRKYSMICAEAAATAGAAKPTAERWFKSAHADNLIEKEKEEKLWKLTHEGHEFLQDHDQ